MGHLHVGMRFGAEFVPIYQRHPDVEWVSIADTDPKRVDETRSAFGIDRRHGSLQECSTFAVPELAPAADVG